jgi:hypothetical protein
MRVARQLLSALRRSGAARTPLHRAPEGAAGDGRDPGLRLAGLHLPGLGPRGSLLVPPAGLLGPDRRLTQVRSFAQADRPGPLGLVFQLPRFTAGWASPWPAFRCHPLGESPPVLPGLRRARTSLSLPRRSMTSLSQPARPGSRHVRGSTESPRVRGTDTRCRRNPSLPSRRR